LFSSRVNSRAPLLEARAFVETTAGSWFESVNLWVLVAFHLVIFVLLAVDLVLVSPGSHGVGFRRAGIWSAVWVALALLFALGIWKYWDRLYPAESGHGSQRSLEFLTGYLVEKALSIDNLFVFVMIFRYFQVPPALQHRVLLWGLIGALVLRAGMIVGGIALLNRFHGLMYVLGAIVIYAGIRMCWTEPHIDPEKNFVLRWSRRWLPIAGSYDSSRFVLRHEGRWRVTPLFVVLLAIESTDLLFALDSIPAVFGITTDPLIVYTSNIFAILGLRSLYFLLAGLLELLRFLHVGVGIVLLFVGAKMIFGDWYPVPVLWSLAFIALTLATAVAVSLFVKLAKPGASQQAGKM
jgi:tellurite resistance protein TerC